MKYYYDKKTKSFFIDAVNDEIPVAAVEITAQQHGELYNALNSGCVIFDDLTYSEPKPSQFHEWDGQQWVENIVAHNQYIIEQNQSMKNSLITEANEKIAILQDSIDLDMQESNEEEQLKQWKKYRIILTRVDTSDTNIVFPAKPE